MVLRNNECRSNIINIDRCNSDSLGYHYGAPTLLPARGIPWRELLPFDGFLTLFLLGKGIPKQILVWPMAGQESLVTLKDHSFHVGQLTSQTRVLEDRNAHIEAHFCYITNDIFHITSSHVSARPTFFSNVLVHGLGPIKEKSGY